MGAASASDALGVLLLAGRVGRAQQAKVAERLQPVTQYGWYSFLHILLARDKRDQALLIGQFLQLYGCLANIDHNPIDL